MKISAVNNFLKFNVKLGMLIAGYAAESCKKSEEVTVIQREFVSSEDGDLFISRLEGFPSIVLSKIAKEHNTVIVPSSIDNMLVLLRKDMTATVFVNAPIRGLIQVKKSVKAGEIISVNDIADIRELVFDSIEIPEDGGIIILFSVRWRKGLFFDIVSLADDKIKRDYNLNQLLGSYYAYLTFQERFKITDSEWENFFKNGWFPFITLKNSLVSDIIHYNREGFNIDELLPRIQDSVTKRLPDGLKTWANIKVFKAHIDFINKAAERYQQNDFISCISVLFPRIEGIMREFQSTQECPEKVKQKELAGTVLSKNVNPKDHLLSPLLPLKFSQYLSEVYFANFDPTKKDNALSRNTVGHGVATKEDFNLKSSTLGFLILDQLSYYFHGVK